MKSLSILVEMSKSCFFPVSLFQQSNNNTSNVFSSLTLSEIQAWSESFERLMASLGESIISEHLYTCPSSLNTSEHLSIITEHFWTLEHLSIISEHFWTLEHLSIISEYLSIFHRKTNRRSSHWKLMIHAIFEKRWFHYPVHSIAKILRYNLFRRSPSISRVLTVWIQWGEHSLLDGLWGPEEGDEPWEGGGEGTDDLRRLRFNFVTQRGESPCYKNYYNYMER